MILNLIKILATFWRYNYYINFNIYWQYYFLLQKFNFSVSALDIFYGVSITVGVSLLTKFYDTSEMGRVKNQFLIFNFSEFKHYLKTFFLLFRAFVRRYTHVWNVNTFLSSYLQHYFQDNYSYSTNHHLFYQFWIVSHRYDSFLVSRSWYLFFL